MVIVTYTSSYVFFDLRNYGPDSLREPVVIVRAIMMLGQAVLAMINLRSAKEFWALSSWIANAQHTFDQNAENILTH